MRVLGRPKILVLALLLSALASAFVTLGFWQLDRLSERQEYNSTLTDRMSEPVLDVRALPSDPSEIGEFAYRRATATGRYDLDEEIIIVGRSRNAISGYDVVTPLVLDDRALVVNRGWVELNDSQPPIEAATPPDQEVTLTGVLFPSQSRGRFGPKHPEGERLDAFHRIDIPRMQAQSEHELLGLYLLIETQEPAQASPYPKSLSLPKLDEGPHRSYAFQWFAFALMAVATFVAYVRQSVKKLGA